MKNIGFVKLLFVSYFLFTLTPELVFSQTVEIRERLAITNIQNTVQITVFRIKGTQDKTHRIDVALESINPNVSVIVFEDSLFTCWITQESSSEPVGITVGEVSDRVRKIRYNLSRNTGEEQIINSVYTKRGMVLEPGTSIQASLKTSEITGLETTNPKVKITVPFVIRNVEDVIPEIDLGMLSLSTSTG